MKSNKMKNFFLFSFIFEILFYFLFSQVELDPFLVVSSFMFFTFFFPLFGFVL